MSDWIRHSTADGNPHPFFYTTEQSPDRRHVLQVTHSPHAAGSNVAPTHRLLLGSYGRTSQWTHGATVEQYTGPDDHVSHVLKGGDGELHSHPGPLPDALREQIETYHETGAWMPLLDAVAEHVPDSDVHVSEHTAARMRGS